MLLHVLLNSDEQFQHPLVHSFIDLSLLLVDHTSNVCRADAVIEGIWLIYDDQQCLVPNQETALQIFRAPAYPLGSAEPLPVALPLPLLNGSVQLKAFLSQTSHSHGNRVFRLRCQVKLPSQSSASPLLITGHSQPFCAVRYKLEMENTLPEVFYKDRGGDSQSLEINGRILGGSAQPVAATELESLTLQLSVLYENRQRVDTTQKTILSVKTCSVDAAASTFFCNFRILEVSRHHRGQRFCVCVLPSIGDIAPLITAAFEVKSKKLASKKEQQMATTINASFNQINTNIHNITTHFGSVDIGANNAAGESFRTKKRQRQPGLGSDPNVARALNILLVGYESLINTIKKNEWEPVGDDGQYTTYKCKFCGVFCLSLSTPLHRPTCPIWGHMQTHDAAVSAVIPLLRAVALDSDSAAEETKSNDNASAAPNGEFVRFHTAATATSSSSSTSSSASSASAPANPSSTTSAAAAAAMFIARSTSTHATAPQKFPAPSPSSAASSFPSSFGPFGFDGAAMNPFELNDMDDLCGNLFGTTSHLPLTCGQERALEESEEGFMDQFFTETQMRSMGGTVTPEALQAAKIAAASTPSSSSPSSSSSSSSSSALASSSSSAPSSTTTAPLAVSSPSSLTNTTAVNGTPVKNSASSSSSSSSLAPAVSSLSLSPSHPLHPSHPSHRPHVAPSLPLSPEVWRVMEQLKLERQMVDLSVSDSESDEGDEGDEEEETPLSP